VESAALQEPKKKDRVGQQVIFSTTATSDLNFQVPRGNPPASLGDKVLINKAISCC
jgi:hypothetical protein